MAGNDSTWQMVAVKRWILLVFVAACDRGAPGGADGAELYRNACATCHGPNGTPAESMVVRLGVRDLRSDALRATITPAFVEQQVRKGSPNRLMPSFEGALTDEQIRAVSAFVASAEFLDP